MLTYKVLFLRVDCMYSSIEISKRERGFSITISGGMVQKLFPVFVSNVIKVLTLMRSIRTEEVRRARCQVKGNFNKSLTNLVNRKDVGLYGRVNDHTYSCMLVFKGAIEMEGETL